MIAIYCIISFIFSWLGIKLFLPTLSSKLIDVPVFRSSHNNPIPKGAGIILPLIIIPFSIYYGNYIPLICAPLSVVGLIDDIKELSSLIRFSFQLLTAGLLIKYSNLNLRFIFDQSFLLSLGEIIFLILVIAAVVNFVNFMDGIDGLIGGSMFLIFIVIGITLTPLGFIISSAILGFLMWNWHPAKVFMGDVGSTYLGSLLAAFMINTNSYNSSLSLMLILTPIFGDAFITLAMRLIKRKNIFVAHKSHLYQRLYQNGISQSYISACYCLLILALAVVNFFFTLPVLIFSSILTLFLGLFVDRKFAINFY